MQEHLSLIRRRKGWDLSDGDGEEAMSLMTLRFDTEGPANCARQQVHSAWCPKNVPQSQPWLAAREDRASKKTL